MADIGDGDAAIHPSAVASGKESLDDKPPSRCYLLELPRELRNQIYKLALRHENGASVNLKTGCVDRKHIALTMTNKQLHEECRGLYFKVNTFAFAFTYIPNTDENMTYDCLDEKATFNYFARRYAADLCQVRLRFKGLDSMQRIVWVHGGYFLDNVAPLRSGLEVLRSNNIQARLSIYLEPINLDITLLDKGVAKVEIDRQVYEAAPGGDISQLEESPGWVECMKQVLVNVLYGAYTKRLCRC